MLVSLSFASSSRPHRSSIVELSGIDFTVILQMRPRPATVATTIQTNRVLSANAVLTSSWRGPWSCFMIGITWYTTPVPEENWDSKLAGSLFINSFCRMAPPTVTPKIWNSWYHVVSKQKKEHISYIPGRRNERKHRTQGHLHSKRPEGERESEIWVM